MKKIKGLQFIFFLGFFFLSACSTTSSKSSFQLRGYKTTQLSNGLEVIMIKDSSLPYFSMQLLLKSGSSEDPNEQRGLANLVAELLPKGTKHRNASELAEALDFIGADFSANVSKDYTILSSSTLSFHKEKLIDVFSEMVLEPAFRSSEVERLKAQLQAGLKKSIDNPSWFANQVFSKFVFGDSPYSHSVLGNVSGLSSIRQKHINRFYLRHYRPNQSVLAIVGNFEDGLMSKIEKQFSGWQKRADEQSPSFEFPAISGKEFLLVNKDKSTQAQVRIGAKGISRNHPDYLALRMANTILGGSFASRLSDKIRDDLGLTYGVSSYFDAKKSVGPFAVTTYTRTEKVKELLEQTFKILEEFKSEGVTEAEIEKAKGLMKGSFPRAIETAEKFAFNLLHLRFHGVSESYLANFFANVDDLSVNKVNKVIKENFDSSNLKIVVLGDVDKIKPQLKNYDKVSVEPFKKFQ